MATNIAREVDPLLKGLHEVYVYIYNSNQVSFEHNATGRLEDLTFATIERKGDADYRVQHFGYIPQTFDNLNDALTFLAECVTGYNTNTEEV